MMCLTAKSKVPHKVRIMYCYIHYHAVSNVGTCSFSYASVAVEFDPTTYTVTESEGAVVMFQIVKRTMTTRPVSVLFSTSPGTAKGNRTSWDVM